MQLTELINEAVERYRTADAQERKVLETVYGKKTFSKCLKITERIKDFNDICIEAGVDPLDYVVTDDMTARQKRAIYTEKIYLIAEVLNEGVKLDWSNGNQRKWAPWFKWNGAGFGFSGSDYDFGNTFSGVGSRFASEELSDFAGKKFTKEYNDYLTA
jgi:hypothetical protein